MRTIERAVALAALVALPALAAFAIGGHSRSTAPASARGAPALQRFIICGTTGTTRTTTITTPAPMLLQAFREDWTSTSGVGSLRIGYRPANATVAGGSVPSLYPTAWVNGDLWLPFAGDWEVTVWSDAELASSGPIDFDIPYVGIAHPDEATLSVALSGYAGGRPSYHYEQHVSGAAWNQIMKPEQRLIVGRAGTLSVRCGGALRYRWGGPPNGELFSDGGAYDVLEPGETLRIDPMPLASLWVRADDPTCPSEINWMSQRLR